MENREGTHWSKLVGLLAVVVLLHAVALGATEGAPALSDLPAGYFIDPRFGEWGPASASLDISEDLVSGDLHLANNILLLNLSYELNATHDGESWIYFTGTALTGNQTLDIDFWWNEERVFGTGSLLKPSLSATWFRLASSEATLSSFRVQDLEEHPVLAHTSEYDLLNALPPKPKAVPPTVEELTLGPSLITVLGDPELESVGGIASGKHYGSHWTGRGPRDGRGEHLYMSMSSLKRMGGGNVFEDLSTFDEIDNPRGESKRVHVALWAPGLDSVPFKAQVFDLAFETRIDTSDGPWWGGSSPLRFDTAFTKPDPDGCEPVSWSVGLGIGFSAPVSPGISVGYSPSPSDCADIEQDEDRILVRWRDLGSLPGEPDDAIGLTFDIKGFGSEDYRFLRFTSRAVLRGWYTWTSCSDAGWCMPTKVERYTTHTWNRHHIQLGDFGLGTRYIAANQDFNLADFTVAERLNTWNWPEGRDTWFGHEGTDREIVCWAYLLGNDAEGHIDKDHKIRWYVWWWDQDYGSALSADWALVNSGNTLIPDTVGTLKAWKTWAKLRFPHDLDPQYFTQYSCDLFIDNKKITEMQFILDQGSDN